MEAIDPADREALSLADLQSIQRTLERRVGSRDAANILAVGFGPKRRGAVIQQGLAARFLVRRKRDDVPQRRRIQPVEPVRLLDRSRGRFRQLLLKTDVVQTRRPQPVGVRVRDGQREATTAAVVRWTTRQPPPPDPHSDDPDDPRWRWGLLTVAHLFDGKTRREGKIERRDACGDQPTTIEGSVVAAGRLPGGPDAAVMETGLDRLWLSGFLPDPTVGPLQAAGEADVMEWIRGGISGYAHRAGPVRRWRFATYFPEQTIPGLGRLRHVIQFSADPADHDPAPFGPGSSGSILVAAGAPAGMQVAAESPSYRTAYAQLFEATVPWLRESLAASRVVLVRVV